MSKFEMPIRHYLRGEFNAEVNETGEDPFEAFARLESALGSSAFAYDTYAQATITSGGHARNPELSWLEIVKKNVAYAQAMAEDLYDSGELDPMKTIEASTLGLVEHWRESDYITFWLTTLARPDMTGYGSAHRVDDMRRRLQTSLQDHHIDISTFNDYTRPREERAPNYFILADAFYDAVGGVEHEPVERLVAVSETSGSLGASTERYFAKKLGAHVYGLAIAQLGGQTLPPDYPRGLLAEDTEIIVCYGGQIFDPREKTRILLVRQE